MLIWCKRYIPGFLVLLDSEGNETNQKWRVLRHTSGSTITIIVEGLNGQGPPVDRDKMFKLRPDWDNYNGIMGWGYKGDFTPRNIHCIRSIQYPSTGYPPPFPWPPSEQW